MIALFAATAHAQPRSTKKKKVATHDRPTSAEKHIVVAPPAPVAAPGLTLSSGAVQLQTTLELGDTTSVAPDISIGASDQLTLSFITSASAMTGFRGTAGSGVCISDGCDRRLVDGGIAALFALNRGTIATALDFGILASSVGPLHTDMKLGLKMKLTGKHAYVVASPNLWLALDDRHADQVWVPISGWVKIDAVALGVGTGIKGPLADINDGWTVPLGGLVQTTPLESLSLGASLVFGKVVGGDAVMDTGFKAYAIQVWTTVTAR